MKAFKRAVKEIPGVINIASSTAIPVESIIIMVIELKEERMKLSL